MAAQDGRGTIKMRAGVIAGVAGVVLVLGGWSHTEAQAPAACRTDGNALGVARTVSLDGTRAHATATSNITTIPSCATVR